MPPGPGNRIVVVGSSGAGKSTLAAEPSGQLGGPFVELDALHWEPGWVAAEREVFRERVRRAVAGKTWVLAGNYTRHQFDISWPAADTIVWLGLPLQVVLPRLIRRCWRRWRTREKLYGGENRERFWEHLLLWDTEKSLIAYTIRHHRGRSRLFESHLRNPHLAHLTVVRLRSRDKVQRWLGHVCRAAGSAAQPATGD